MERGGTAEVLLAALSPAGRRTRLDSKSSGAVVLVMERVHEDDLAGRLLEKGGWQHLKVAAIAEMDEQIPIGRHRIYKRKVGDIIDPTATPWKP